MRALESGSVDRISPPDRQNLVTAGILTADEPDIAARQRIASQ
ncbi:hypothetical protein ACGFW5_24510 [Streptomyces sp. NPDC048416]